MRSEAALLLRGDLLRGYFPEAHGRTRSPRIDSLATRDVMPRSLVQLLAHDVHPVSRSGAAHESPIDVIAIRALYGEDVPV